MKVKLGAVIFLLVVAFAAAATQAATQAAGSRPAAGDWSGSFKVKPATSVLFTVTAKGHKRAVSGFESSGNFDTPCHAGAANATTTVGGFGNDTVSGSGTFKGRTSQNNGFGTSSMVLAGKFKGGHASGTVAIVIPVSSTKRCKFTVRWSASLAVAGHPKDGATYTGKQQNSDGTVKFKVSSDGKELTTVTWDQPLVDNCPGASANQVVVTGTDVPIHGSKFSYTQHSGQISNGAGTVVTETITGLFMSGGKASGTVTTSADIAGIGTSCQGSDTWTAKG